MSLLKSESENGGILFEPSEIVRHQPRPQPQALTTRYSFLEIHTRECVAQRTLLCVVTVPFLQMWYDNKG